MLGLLVGLVSLIAPYSSKLYFDNVYPARDASLLVVLAITIGVLGVATSLMSALRGYYSAVISSVVGSAMGLMYYNHLLHLPVRFFDEHRTGELMSRLGDVRGALGTVVRVTETVLVNGVYLLIVPPFLMVLSWKLAIVALITTPLTVLVSVVTGPLLRSHLKQSAEATAELGAIQVELLSQIRTLKALAGEHIFFAHVRKQAELSVRAQLKANGLSTAVGLCSSVVQVGGAGFYSWYAWTLILEGEITLGTFVAFSAYLGYLIGPVGALAGLFTDFQRTAVTLERSFEYLDVEPEQDPLAAHEPPPKIAIPVRGELSVEGVSFGYSRDQQVLRSASVVFPKGTSTAIVGDSGAGKSTLIRLLCRIEEPTAGAIRLDGSDLVKYPLPELRRQLGVVWQDPSLFRGTIWENLTFGTEAIAVARVVEVVRLCRLDSLLSELPQGFDTSVAEWGATVSGGQRQRLALARTLLREARVLLLDEPMSQVDMRTEDEVMRDMLVEVKGRTVVFVTHRLTTARLADRICVMKAGQVIGSGTHEELLSSCDEYARMVRFSQSETPEQAPHGPRAMS
ncbi:MAG: peptidase domain-containing ABC transporter [Pseudomonadota bacterium]